MPLGSLRIIFRFLNLVVSLSIKMSDKAVVSETAKVNEELPGPVSRPSDDSWMDDPRIAFSQASGKWIFEDDTNGIEYEYDEGLKKWVPLPSEDEVRRQQEAYYNDHEERSAKRKTTENSVGPKKKQNAHGPRKPTAVYISNLPTDVTIEELEETFSRFGVIAEDLNTNQKKIKLYKDEMDMPKGDALVVYFKPESVELAIQIMDGMELRPGISAERIVVQQADFKEKAIPPSEKQLSDQDKAKIKKKIQKLNK
jgi:HIV Tat-specific factor 1